MNRMLPGLRFIVVYLIVFREYDSMRAVPCGLQRLDFHHIRLKMTLHLFRVLCAVQMLLSFPIVYVSAQFMSTCKFVDNDTTSFESLSFHAVKSHSSVIS